MINRDELKKTTAKIYLNDEFEGSGVIFMHNDELCVITAGHVIYGKKFSKNPLLSNITIKDKDDNCYKVEEIKGDNTFATIHDIVLLKLLKQNIANDIICLHFCTVSSHPLYDNYILRGTYSNKENASNNLYDIKNDEKHDLSNSKFLMQIDRNQLISSDYKHGSEWLDGLSGSGIFYKNIEGEINCTGILLEIPNNGDHGKLLCSNIKILETIGINLDFKNGESLDVNSELNSKLIAKLIQGRTEQTVEDWEKALDNIQSELIDKKIKELYPAKRLKEHKYEVVKNLLVGQDYMIVLRRNKDLYKKYENLFLVFGQTQVKLITVESRKEARDKYDNINEKYKEFLNKELNKLELSNIFIIANYGISEWLANCNLDFEKDEE
jgi:hypothetical protein